jgi:hypothetical protein
VDLRVICWGVWRGFTWLRIGTVGGLLWVRWWTFGFWRHGVSYLRFLVPTAASMKVAVFWNVAFCSLEEVCRRFRGAYCLSPEGVDTVLVQKYGIYLQIWTVWQSRTTSTTSQPWEP